MNSTASPETNNIFVSAGAVDASPLLDRTSATLAESTPSRAPSLVRERAYQLAALLVLGDFVVATCATYLGLVLRDWQRAAWSIAALQQSAVSTSSMLWGVATAGLYVWLMLLVKAYDVTALYAMQRWTVNMAKMIVLWAILILAFTGFFGPELNPGFIPRVGLLYCMAFMAVTQFAWRGFAYAFLAHPLIRDSANSRVIVVGWNDNAAQLRQALRRDPSQMSEIIGCVPVPGGHFAVKPPPDVAVLGDYSALPELVAECGVSSVILADISCAASEIHKLIGFCQREMLGFKMVPQYFPALVSGLQVVTVGGIPLLGVSRLPFDRTLNRLLKRAIDIVGGAVGLVLTASITAFFCALVYLESPGPVIYRQRRTTRNGRPFYLYKIRSMHLNAEAGTGAVWCKKDDNRRLRIGTFMRRWNIDELPQFVNVLKGDMSLVGPRPERPELIERFKDSIPNYNARHGVRAGLTGWAQIQGLRGDTDLQKRIEADLWYLENWSPLLDVYCIVATFFKTKNAY